MATRGDQPAASASLDVRVGISSAFWGNPTGDLLGPWLQRVKAIGYEGITRFADFWIWNDEPADPAALRSLLDTSGLELTSLVTGVHANLDRYRIHAQAIATVGCRDLVCIGGTGKAPSDFERLGSMMNRIGEAVAAFGVRVSYHNHTDTTGETFADVTRLLEATDPELVSVNYDIGHATKDFADLPPDRRATELIQGYGERLGIVEFKDWSPETDLDTPLGNGLADLDGATRTLRERAYSGWIVVEQNDEIGRSLEERYQCAAESLRCVRSLLGHPAADAAEGGAS